METTSARRSGWQTALDVLIAPGAAFSNLRVTPTWGWAFIISTVLGIVGAVAVGPTVAHVLGIELATRLSASPQLAGMPADQRATMVAQQIGIAQTIAKFSFVFVPFGLAIGSALQALVMLVVNAIAKGEGTFKKLWAVAVNAAITGTGVASLVLAAIVLLRGTDGFANSSEIASALPGLGMFVPAGAKAAAAFLGVINVFAIWNMALLVAGMTIVARIPRNTAIVAAVLMLLGTGLFPLLGALFQK